MVAYANVEHQRRMAQTTQGEVEIISTIYSSTLSTVTLACASGANGNPNSKLLILKDVPVQAHDAQEAVELTSKALNERSQGQQLQRALAQST